MEASRAAAAAQGAALTQGAARASLATSCWQRLADAATAALATPAAWLGPPLALVAALAQPAPAAGDWQCASCGGGDNAASRLFCRKCNLPRTAAVPAALAGGGGLEPDRSQHCLRFWRTGACKWGGGCPQPYSHHGYVCGSTSHGTGQHALWDGGGGHPTSLPGPPR